MLTDWIPLFLDVLTKTRNVQLFLKNRELSQYNYNSADTGESMDQILVMFAFIVTKC